VNTYKTGSIEYVTVTVKADVELEAQQVAISIDGGATWLGAMWLGVPGTTRRARTAAAVNFGPPRRGTVLVRVSDSSEAPIMEAGDFMVLPL